MRLEHTTSPIDAASVDCFKQLYIVKLLNYHFIIFVYFLILRYMYFFTSMFDYFVLYML